MNYCKEDWKKTERAAKGDKSLVQEVKLIKEVLDTLEEGKSIRTLDLSSEELEIIKSFNLLSSKPIIYVANISEEDLVNDEGSNDYVEKVREFAATENAEVITVSAEIEEEISQLEDEEKNRISKGSWS